MANQTTGFGLKVLPTKNGQQPRIRQYYVPAAYATALYVGSPVLKTGTANTTNVNGKYKPGELPAINHAATTGAITGIIESFEPTPTSSLLYNAASTERVANVIDDPDAIYRIRCNAALAEVDVGLNANISAASGGSAFVGDSNVLLDVATKATTSSLQLKILKVSPYDDFADDNLIVNGSGVVVEVKINNSTEANTTAGI